MCVTTKHIWTCGNAHKAKWHSSYPESERLGFGNKPWACPKNREMEQTPPYLCDTCIQALKGIDPAMARAEEKKKEEWHKSVEVIGKTVRWL